MKTVFEESYEDFRARTGGTFDTWRARGAQAYENLKRSEHWHGGRPCREVGCENGKTLG